MATALRYIDKHDPKEDGSLRKELDEVNKMKKSESIGKKPAKVIPDLCDIDRNIKKYGVIAAAFKNHGVKILNIKKRKLAK